jgi:hypothetical protein
LLPVVDVDVLDHWPPKGNISHVVAGSFDFNEGSAVLQKHDMSQLRPFLLKANENMSLTHKFKLRLKG